MIYHIAFWSSSESINANTLRSRVNANQEDGKIKHAKYTQCLKLQYM